MSVLTNHPLFTHLTSLSGRDDLHTMDRHDPYVHQMRQAFEAGYSKQAGHVHLHDSFNRDRHGIYELTDVQAQWIGFVAGFGVGLSYAPTLAEARATR